MKKFLKINIAIIVVTMLFVSFFSNCTYASDLNDDFFEDNGPTEDSNSPSKDDTTSNTEIPKAEENLVPVTGVELESETVTIKVGETLNLKATVFPTNARNKKITWKSDNGIVAIVVSGVLVGLNEGEATITATTEDGNFTDTCIVTVEKGENQQTPEPEPEIINVTGITLNKETITLKTGDISLLKALVLPIEATNKRVKWISDNELSAIVVEGVIIGLSEGTSTITAITEDGNFIDSCIVNVEKKDVEKEPIPEPESSEVKVTGILLDKKNIEMKIGEFSILKATVLPENATNNDVIWESDNEEVAIVASGLVVCKAEGVATISVKTEDGNFIDKCVVKVKKNEEQIEPEEDQKTDKENINVTGVKLDKEKITMENGEISILKAKVFPEKATNKNIIWTSSNEESVIVVEGVIICIEEGKSIITATTEDGSYTSSCEVTVSKRKDLVENKVDQKENEKKEEKKDITTVKGEIPKAGIKTIGIVICIIVIVTWVVYKRYKKLDDI